VFNFIICSLSESVRWYFLLRYCDWKFVWFSQCFNMCYMSNPSHSIILINVVISRFLCNFSEMRLEVSKWLGWRFKSFWDVTWSYWVSVFVTFLQRSVIPSSSRVNSQRRILLTQQYNITSQKTWIVSFSAADCRTEWQSFGGTEC